MKYSRDDSSDNGEAGLQCAGTKADRSNNFILTPVRRSLILRHDSMVRSASRVLYSLLPVMSVALNGGGDGEHADNVTNSIAAAVILSNIAGGVRIMQVNHS